MKKTILTLAIMIAITTSIFGQSKDEQDIRKLFEMSATALVKNDIAALSNYYADDLTLTTADGNTHNKTQFLDFVKNTKHESFKFDDLSVRTFGNTAVVNFTRTSTDVNNDGAKTNSKSRDTAMLTKNGGRWQFIALQISGEMANNQSGGSEEQEIRQMLGEVAAALVRKDAKALANYYADNYSFVNPDGTVTNKAQRLEGAKTSRFETFSYEDLNIRQMGNAAVVVARPTYTVKLENGQTVKGQDRATMTLAKMNGRWQLVATQTTRDNPGTGDQAATEKQITDILADWGNALGRRDAAAVDKILADDFMLMSPDGKLYTNRAEYLEVVKNFPGEATITGKGEKTIVMSDTAVQSGSYSVTPKAGGQTTNYSYTATFVRRGGRWMPIAFNSRAIMQK